MSHVADHMDAVRGLVPEQYKNSTKLNGLVASVMHGCDDVETMLQELRGLWDIQSMEGKNLDIIGQVVGVHRNAGEGDEDYRQRLAAGPVERDLPTYESLRNVVKAMTGSERVGIYPVWPAGVYVVVETAGEDVRDLLERWVAAGVGADLGTFLCDEDNEAVYIVDEDTGMPFVVDG